MTTKVLGAFFVLCGCGGFGYSMSSLLRKAEYDLQMFYLTLERIRNELMFRRTPLPELCREASAYSKGTVSTVFSNLTNELESQQNADVYLCMQQSICNIFCEPDVTELFLLLGKNLGSLDLNGQSQNIDEIIFLCKQKLEKMQAEKEERMHNCKTLSLCAGAALAILLI